MHFTVLDTQDAYVAPDDLMAVTDVLCPAWPARPITVPPGIYRR